MADKTRILAIDDDLAIRRFLRASFDPADYELIDAETGGEGIRAAAREKPDVILLDLGLPDMNGLEVAASLREWCQAPIIVLSARGQEGDKIAALDAGADDYLTKPFSVGELMARIRAALRRATPGDSRPVFEAAELKVDLASREVWSSGERVHLTPNEYALLAELVRHSGRVLTHRQLLTAVWGADYVEETHYLRVYIAQLRQKLEVDPAQPKLLINEPGVGYRLAG